uniref:SHSP domain-containing protein n=1 Tax=Kalanchoe fedtschenkoi TaxID=63787 RepID=A0A7N0SXQ8_KALFE
MAAKFFTSPPAKSTGKLQPMATMFVASRLPAGMSSPTLSSGTRMQGISVKPHHALFPNVQAKKACKLSVIRAQVGGGKGDASWDIPIQDGINEADKRKKRVPWDVRNTENELTMRFDMMPGLLKEELQIVVEDGFLIINELIKKKGDGKGNNSWATRSYRPLSFRLPDDCDKVRIKAELKDGVLFVSIQKMKGEGEEREVDIQEG